MESKFHENNKAITEALLKAFEERGYSKEWITDPANEGRISSYTAGLFDYVFMVDGIPLFSLVSESVDFEEDKGFICKFRIKQY